MKELYKALSEKYEGADVRDVKFVVNPAEVDDQDVACLDRELAEAVRTATPIEGPDALM